MTTTEDITRMTRKQIAVIDLRAKAYAQARRIREYLPRLREREQQLEIQLEDVRALIRDEEKAAKELQAIGNGRGTK